MAASCAPTANRSENESILQNTMPSNFHAQMSALPAASTLPSAIVDRDQWVCWRTQERDGKPTKVPINPVSSRFGSATNPDSWTDFETARETALSTSADGIGFVFTEDDPFVGVDLDDCRVPKTGTLSDDAERIIATLDSYTEVSPSGTGVHVLVDGELPGNRNRKDWVECYETARFFTVTGDHCPGTPPGIEARNTELKTVYAEFIDPRESAPTNGADDSTPEQDADDQQRGFPDLETHQATPAHGLSDAALIERAHDAANGEKFGRLWRGNTAGYESHSEADMALCSLLAFWTGRDTQRIDALFRESGLMRTKWDEQHFADGSTYGEKTIARAVAGTDAVYTPGCGTDDDTDSDDELDRSPDAQAVTGEGTEDAHPNSVPGTENTVTDGSTSNHDSDPSARAAGAGGTDLQSSETDDHLQDLPAQQDELVALVDRLQTQVERLEEENQRLQSELDSKPEQPDPETGSPGSSGGLLGRLVFW